MRSKSLEQGPCVGRPHPDPFAHPLLDPERGAGESRALERECAGPGRPCWRVN